MPQVVTDRRLGCCLKTLNSARYSQRLLLERGGQSGGVARHVGQATGLVAVAGARVVVERHVQLGHVVDQTLVGHAAQRVVHVGGRRPADVDVQLVANAVQRRTLACMSATMVIRRDSLAGSSVP